MSVHAVVATAYGDLDVIDVIEVESRPPGPGEVTIAVRATGLNPSDASTAAGRWGADPAMLPRRLGAEASGVVTALGPDADEAAPLALDGTRLAIGDAVFGYPLPGAQASELTVAADQLLLKPDALGFDEASGLLLAGTTAVHAVEAVGVRHGDTVLVHGASGGVGTIVAQLALLRGARVIGTASPRHHEQLAGLGVEPVAYGDGLPQRVRALAPGGVDAGVDTVGTDEALAVSRALVADPGRMVTIVNFRAFLEAGGKAIGGGPGADPGREIRSAARVHLAHLAGEGRLRIPVAATYPLEEAREAYRYLMTGHAGGKVVLRP